MKVAEFVRTWAASTATERQASQSHFIQLCRVLDETAPNDDPGALDIYCFEKGAEKTGGGDGFADVWLQGHFGWEYKGKHKDLQAAYKQLIDYHENLGNPPLLVVCDMERFEVHTKWTNQESWTYAFRNADLATDDPVTVRGSGGAAIHDAPRLTAIQVLKALWDEPERLKPTRSTEQITREAAQLFEKVASQLRSWTVPNTREQLLDDMRIARFISRVLFCMFASDVGLLPPNTFSALLQDHAHDDRLFREALADLFQKMNTGGRFGPASIRHFNGELFLDDDVPEHLTTQEILTLRKLDDLNWADVEPSIFGTLFERVLDKTNQRARLGAHYTSREDIETLVEPVLMAPLRRKWADTRAQVLAYLEDAEARHTNDQAQRGRVRALVSEFQGDLARTRVLDPACGSGNFLYVSLALMKALEKEALAFAGMYGVTLEPRVHPRQLYGIEVNPYAHQLASIVIWIGYLQWKHHNAVPLDDEDPILQRLDQIKLMDAILDLSDPAAPKEPEWPEVEVIVGNPPFLGGKLLRRQLGDAYVDAMFKVWDGRVRREADLCCYWHEKARAMIAARKLHRAGLLATQAIRGGANRATLQRIKESGQIFFAIADQPWVLDGAAVQVSMVGQDDGTETGRTLDGRPVDTINANLTSGRLDLTTARGLPENAGISFMGDTKIGPFEVDKAAALRMLAAPNPNGRPNSDVIKTWANGDDITGRPRGMWIIDFPPGTTEEEASRYEMPFEHIAKAVRPDRVANARATYAQNWWIHGEARPAMRRALSSTSRFICTPRVSKHRLFVWLQPATLPDSATIAFSRDDDYFFGVLHSKVHELWALAQGTQLREKRSGFRYTPTRCFETFPLPWPPGKEPWGDPLVSAIAEAARELNELRERWLNPGPVDGQPMTEAELKKRTLTNLYNERPQWLANAHAKLDAAVFAAYGWPERPDTLPDEEILARLLALNLQRAAAQ
jgi:type II restriction/modification system DNA methylase subunit YeeA